MIKSPFYVVRNFLSPLACEQIVDRLDFLTPDIDASTGQVLSSFKRHDGCESLIFERAEGKRRTRYAERALREGRHWNTH